MRYLITALILCVIPQVICAQDEDEDDDSDRPTIVKAAPVPIVKAYLPQQDDCPFVPKKDDHANQINEGTKQVLQNLINAQAKCSGRPPEGSALADAISEYNKLGSSPDENSNAGAIVVTCGNFQRILSAEHADVLRRLQNKLALDSESTYAKCFATDLDEDTDEEKTKSDPRPCIANEFASKLEFQAAQCNIVAEDEQTQKKRKVLATLATQIGALMKNVSTTSCPAGDATALAQASVSALGTVGQLVGGELGGAGLGFLADGISALINYLFPSNAQKSLDEILDKQDFQNLQCLYFKAQNYVVGCNLKAPSLKPSSIVSTEQDQQSCKLHNAITTLDTLLADLGRTVEKVERNEENQKLPTGKILQNGAVVRDIMRSLEFKLDTSNAKKKKSLSMGDYLKVMAERVKASKADNINAADKRSAEKLLKVMELSTAIASNCGHGDVSTCNKMKDELAERFADQSSALKVLELIEKDPRIGSSPLAGLRQYEIKRKAYDIQLKTFQVGVEEQTKWDENVPQVRQSVTALVSNLKGKFEKHLKLIYKKAVAGLNSSDQAQRQRTASELDLLVKTCMLNASMYYFESKSWNSDKNSDQKITNPGDEYNSTCKKLQCPEGIPSFGEVPAYRENRTWNAKTKKLEKPIDQVSKANEKRAADYQQHQCFLNNRFPTVLASIKKEFITSGKICGKEISSLR